MQREIIFFSLFCFTQQTHIHNFCLNFYFLLFNCEHTWKKRKKLHIRRIIFLSFGKRIDVFMSKKYTHTHTHKKKRLLFNFYIQIRERRREKKNANIHKHINERESDFFALNIRWGRKAMILMFLFFFCYKSFVIAINQIKDGKLTTRQNSKMRTHTV